MTTSSAERTAVPSAITTTSAVDTPIGALKFNDGYPTTDTAAKLRDHLDYLHGVETFMNTIPGVSTYALRQGFLDAGVMDNDFLIFSELMDSRTLALTANADTVYFWSFLDLSQGPLVVETPADTLGLLDDTGTLSATQNWLRTGWVGSHSGSGVNLVDHGEIVGSAPGFNDFTNGDYGLAAGSPCVDQAVALAAACIPTYVPAFEYVAPESSQTSHPSLERITGIRS